MKHRTCAKLLLVAAAWSAAPVMTWAQENPAAVTTGAQPIPGSDVPHLRTTLFSADSKPEQRDIAARRLLTRLDPEARSAIREGLARTQPSTVQLAVARALAEKPTADASLIAPLFALLEVNTPKNVIDAATSALGAFKDDPEVLSRLLTLAREGGDANIRLAAVRSIGSYVDKRAAETLVNMMNPTAQPATINQAAAEALAYMTGLNADETTPEQFRAWWAQNSGKSELQFRAELVKARAIRYDTARQQIVDLQDEIALMLADQYKRANADQRIELVVRSLRSAQPAVRSAGAKIATNAALAGDFVPPAVKEQLRTLIGDASTDVRRQVAQALELINDADAVVPLLTQLNQEADSTVRAAIARALTPIRDPRSVTPLLKLLDDPRVETAQAAATALSEPELAKQVRAESPDLANSASDKVMATLKSRTAPQNNIELRHSLVRALGVLPTTDQGRELNRLLGSPVEAPKVIRALLVAAGQTRLPELTNAIADKMNDSDPSVRLAAVRALGQTANSFDWQKSLLVRMDPGQEPSAEVQAAAWQVLNELFKTAPTDQLQLLGERFKAEPSRRLAVLKILHERAKLAGSANTVAALEQQMGDAAKEAGLFDEAIEHYRRAFAAAIETKRGPQEEYISESLVEAMLLARKYTDAVGFTQQQIRRDSRFQMPLASKIRKEAERLVESAKDKDFEHARRLIDEVRKMNPPLQQTQLEYLDALSRRMDNRTREQNLTPRRSESPMNARAD